MAKKALDLNWDDSKQYKFFSREIFIPFLACMLMAMGPMVNTTFSGIATSYLMADINAASFMNLQNIINSVFRACAALAWGGIFERYNQKSIILVLSLFQMAAGLLYTVVTNIPVLILGTLVGAIGSGGAMAGLITILGYLLPLQFRGTFHSIRSLINVGLTMVTPFGSWLISSVSWRALYAFNFCCYTITFLVVLIAVPSLPITKEVVKKKYDFVGMFIFILGTAVLFTASFMGGNILPWTSPWLYVFIVGGIFIYYLGLRYEKKHEDIALISITLLKNRSFMSAILVGCMYFASFTVKSYEQLICVQGLGMALTAFTAVKVIPTMIGHGIGVVYPVLMQKTGWYRQISGVVVVINVVSMMYWATMKNATPVSVFIALMLSAATPLSLGQLLAVNSVEQKDMSKAGGTYSFMYYFSSALFSLIYNILLNNVHVANLKPIASSYGIYDKLSASQINTMSTYNVLASAKNLAAFKATFGSNTELCDKAIKVIMECTTAASRSIFWVSAILTATAIFGVFGLRKDMKIPIKPKVSNKEAVSKNS